MTINIIHTVVIYWIFHPVLQQQVKVGLNLIVTQLQVYY